MTAQIHEGDASLQTIQRDIGILIGKTDSFGQTLEAARDEWRRSHDTLRQETERRHNEHATILASHSLKLIELETSWNNPDGKTHATIPQLVFLEALMKSSRRKTEALIQNWPMVVIGLLSVIISTFALLYPILHH